MSFVNRLNEIVAEAQSSLAELIEVFGEDVPDFNERGLNVEKFDMLLDGYQVTHLTEKNAYDERGQQTTISYIAENHLEEFLLDVDKFIYGDKFELVRNAL